MPSISVPAAVIGGAAISGASSLIGSGAQASATENAANSANATQLAMYNQNVARQQPFVTAGTGATTQEQNLLGLNGQAAATNAMGEFTSSPGYQYQVQQGLSAIDNGAASNGTLRSGNTIRAEEGLGSNLANQDFSNYYNRLAGLSSIGENAAANVGNAGTATGQGIASTDTSSGNQLANIYGNASSGVGSAINSGINGLATLNAATTTADLPASTFGASLSATTPTGYVPPVSI
jgi:hypothetical protein